MNTRTKRATATGISLGAVAVVVAGVYAFGAVQPTAEPAPTPTVVREWIPATVPAVDADQLETDAETARAAEAARVAAEQAAQAAQAAADAAAAQAAADEAARASQQQQNTGTGGGDNGGGSTVVAPAAPIRCPAGSTANSNDGVNDTSCFPDICFSIVVPNPDHPECDTAFRP